MKGENKIFKKSYSQKKKNINIPIDNHIEKNTQFIENINKYRKDNETNIDTKNSSYFNNVKILSFNQNPLITHRTTKKERLQFKNLGDHKFFINSQNDLYEEAIMSALLNNNNQVFYQNYRNFFDTSNKNNDDKETREFLTKFFNLFNYGYSTMFEETAKNPEKLTEKIKTVMEQYENIEKNNNNVSAKVKTIIKKVFLQTITYNLLDRKAGNILITNGEDNELCITHIDFDSLPNNSRDKKFDENDIINYFNNQNIKVDPSKQKEFQNRLNNINFNDLPNNTNCKDATKCFTATPCDILSNNAIEGVSQFNDDNFNTWYKEKNISNSLNGEYTYNKLYKFLDIEYTKEDFEDIFNFNEENIKKITNNLIFVNPKITQKETKQIISNFISRMIKYRMKLLEEIKGKNTNTCILPIKYVIKDKNIKDLEEVVENSIKKLQTLNNNLTLMYFDNQKKNIKEQLSNIRQNSVKKVNHSNNFTLDEENKGVAIKK